MKNLLVAGGLGFAGFNFIQYVRTHQKRVKVVCMDSMYISDAFQSVKIKWLEDHGVAFYKYSIGDPNISYIFNIEKIDTLVNFASNLTLTCPDKSLDAAEKVTTNLIGLYHLLELCKKYDIRLHNAINSSVYGLMPMGHKDLVDESMQLDPKDIASATKASAEILLKSFNSSYKTKTTSSRTGEMFGPWQLNGLVAYVIINGIAGPLNAFAALDGLHQLTYVDDNSKAILDILEHGKLGQVYDITSRAVKGDEDLNEDHYIISPTNVMAYIFDELKIDKNKFLRTVPPRREKTSMFNKGEKLREICEFADRDSTIVKDLKKTVKWYVANIKKERVKENEK